MGCVYLIRHGEVQGNRPEERAFVGWGDLPLTPLGERQAEAVSHCLAAVPLRAVYSSDLTRARQTAERIAAPHSLNVRCDAAWREANYGDWEGLGEAQLLAQWPELYRRRQQDPVGVAPPHGEHCGAVWQRLQPVWEKLLAAHAEDDVAVVAHNGALRLLLCHLLQAPLASYRLIQINNASVSAVRISKGDGPPIVENINQTGHLKGIEKQHGS